MQNSQNTLSKVNLLIGLSGSVATIKIQQMLNKFLETQKFSIKVITTQNAKHFFNFQQLKAKYQGKVQFHEDKNEYEMWQKRGDPVLHIELRKWAHIFLVAPLSANTLAKFNAGLCDNLVTLVFRCWDMKISSSKILIKPIILCPAMNNLMYDHPFTSQHLAKMQKLGCRIIDSIEKRLMCGQVGKGAMEEVDNIVARVVNVSEKLSFLFGKQPIQEMKEIINQSSLH